MKLVEQIDKLIGKANTEYIIAEDAFQYDDGLHGVTGLEFHVVNQEEYDQRMSIEGLRDAFDDTWRQAVAEDQTTMGLDEWLDRVEEDMIFDTSGSDQYEDVVLAKYKEETGEDGVLIECIGSGRIFGARLQFDTVYDQETLDRIKVYEEKGFEKGFKID